MEITGISYKGHGNRFGLNKDIFAEMLILNNIRKAVYFT